MQSKQNTFMQTTFKSLRNRNYRYYWIGQCISVIGTQMQRTTQFYLADSLTKSPLLVGLMGACQFLPLLLFSLFAGVIADRFDKKKVLLVTQSLYMLQAFVMAFLTLTGLIRYWHLLVLIIFYGITQSFDMPVRQAFVYELVGKEDILNAISLNSSIMNLGRIIGPTVAGVLMVFFSPGMCFLVNALSYLAVIAGIMMIRLEKRESRPASKRLLGELKNGLIYMKRSEVLMMCITIMMVVSTFSLNNDVNVTTFNRVVFAGGPKGLATLMSAMGVGSLVGTMYMAYSSKHGVRKRFLLYCSVLVALLQMSSILMHQFYMFMLLLVVLGGVNVMYMNTMTALFQVNATDEYRGRVMSVYGFINQGSHPLGNTVAGAAMQMLGGGMGYFFGGSSTLLLLSLVFLVKRKTLKAWITEKNGNGEKTSEAS